MTIDEETLERLRNDDPDLKFLSFSKILRQPILDDNDILRLCQALETNTTLAHLNLDGNRIGDIGAKALAKTKTIKFLVLSDNQIGNAGVEALAKNKSFETLWLQNNIIGDGIAAFAENLTLITLYLMYNHIGDIGAQGLARNKKILKLNLGQNQIGNLGAQALARNKNIIELHLNNNQIGDAGAEAFGQNTTLIMLDLNHNQISSAGAEGFAPNETLAWLSLNNNKIDDVGAHSLIQNKTTMVIGFSDNQISDIHKRRMDTKDKLDKKRAQTLLTACQDSNLNQVTQLLTEGVLSYGVLMEHEIWDYNMNQIDIARKRLKKTGSTNQSLKDIKTFSDLFNEGDNTLLHLAVRQRDLPLLNLLLTHGAGIARNVRNKKNQTYREFAISLNFNISSSTRMQESYLYELQMPEQVYVSYIENPRPYKFTGPKNDNANNNAYYYDSQKLQTTNAYTYTPTQPQKFSSDSWPDTIISTLKSLESGENITRIGDLEYGYYLSDDETIRNEQLLKLIYALKNNTTVIEISFGAHKINNVFVIGLAILLKKNHTLRIVHLDHNKVDDSGGRALVTILKDYNTTIQEITLAHNSISNKILAVIENYLQRNRDMYQDAFLPKTPALTQAQTKSQIQMQLPVQMQMQTQMQTPAPAQTPAYYITKPASPPEKPAKPPKQAQITQSMQAVQSTQESQESQELKKLFSNNPELITHMQVIAQLPSLAIQNMQFLANQKVNLDDTLLLSRHLEQDIANLMNRLSPLEKLNELDEEARAEITFIESNEILSRYRHALVILLGQTILAAQVISSAEVDPTQSISANVVNGIASVIGSVCPPAAPFLNFAATAYNVYDNVASYRAMYNLSRWAEDIPLLVRLLARRLTLAQKERIIRGEQPDEKSGLPYVKQKFGLLLQQIQSGDTLQREEEHALLDSKKILDHMKKNKRPRHKTADQCVDFLLSVIMGDNYKYDSSILLNVNATSNNANVVVAPVISYVLRDEIEELRKNMDGLAAENQRLHVKAEEERKQRELQREKLESMERELIQLKIQQERDKLLGSRNNTMSDESATIESNGQQLLHLRKQQNTSLPMDLEALINFLLKEISELSNHTLLQSEKINLMREAFDVASNEIDALQSQHAKTNRHVEQQEINTKVLEKMLEGGLGALEYRLRADINDKNLSQGSVRPVIDKYSSTTKNKAGAVNQKNVNASIFNKHT